MPTIEILIGMIGSSKSTYARKRADAGALIAAHDDLTAMVHARYRYEQGLRECYRRMEEAIVTEVIDIGRDAVIDRTHLTRESRQRWLDFALLKLPRMLGDFLSIPVIAVTFPIESAEVHARRRYEADPRGRSYEEWLFVAQHHAQQAREEPLELSEGFARIIDGAILLGGQGEP